MTLHVTLFNHFTVADDAGVRRGLRPRVQRLLAYLLLHRERPSPREQLAFTLWPDVPEEIALGTLRRALSDLRSALPERRASEQVIASGSELRWNPNAGAWADVVAFEQLIAGGMPAALHEAVGLYTGDLLAEWSDVWIEAERERLRQLQLDALRRLVAHHRVLADFDIALSFARRLVALDPFAEAAHRDVMTLLYLAGERAAALAAYDRCRTLLRDELGIDPMPETVALRAAIASGALLLSDVEPPPATPIRTSPVMTPDVRLVGRDAELTRLAAQWDAAVSGRGQLAIVSGEAGVGKSRLALALADHVARRGGLVLAGHCYALGQALPYQPVIELLRAAAPALRYTNLAAAHRAALIRLAPDVFGAAAPPTAGDDAAHDPRAQLFEALLQAFLALARGQPLLILIEDLHWAAESTIDWLAYAAPRLGESRLLVVATYRTNEIGAEHALNRLRRRLAREGAVFALALQPLSAGAIRELVGSLSGLRAEEADPVADRLYQETAGNPFFLHEIVRGLVEGGQIVVSQGRWEGPFVDETPESALPLPESLRETITTRIGRLSEMARTFLVAAAVTGPLFRYEIVREAGGWDDERALAALEELLARGFVRESDAGARGEYGFGHHLVREVVYADLTAPRRSYWHQRIADALARAAERLPPNRRQALAGRIVHHASAAEHARLILQWAPSSAEQARGVYAYADALSMLEAASDAFERLRHSPDFDLEVHARPYIDVLLQRSEIMPHVGRTLEEHGRVLQTAADLLIRFPNERQQVQLELRRSDYLSDLRQYEQAAEAALRASERCLALDDQRGAAQGLFQAGQCWATISQNRAACHVLEQARDLYRAAGDTHGETMCLCGIAWACVNMGRVEDALQHLKRALALSEQNGDSLGMARACFFLAVAWSLYYHAEHVQRFAERSVRLFHEIGFAWTVHRPQLFIGVAQFLEGEFARAETTAAQVAGEAHAIRDSWLEGWASQLHGRLVLARGDLAQAERRLERAYDLRQGSGEVQNQVSDLAWLGRLRLAQGRVGAALVYTRQAITQLESLWGECYVWELPDVFYAHAEVLAASGDSAGARHFVERAHDTLMNFAEQVTNDAVKRTFLSHPISARIVAASESGRISSA